MKIQFNGQPHEIETNTTLAAVINQRFARDTDSGIAAAVNGEVLSRSQWHVVLLNDGDEVELLQAVAGG